jgi:hypothetical protein
MKIIKTKTGEEIFIDDDKFDIASKYIWQLKDSKRVITYINGKRIAFAKVVFDLGPNQIIYHTNGNPLDFRKCQIKICKMSELGHIIGNSNQKHSHFKNVYYFERSNSWAVRLIKDSTIIDGGHYYSQEDAAVVADYFILNYLGIKSERNFPELSYEVIKEKYNQILDQYGHNSSEKKARSGQGMIRANDKDSPYVGVSKDKGKWAARIKYNKKTIRLGNFDNQEDAAKAYDKKALELYGDTAKLNFLN